jgi:hypothetical protein
MTTNDIQDFVENNPEEVTLFVSKYGYSKGYDYFVFLKKVDVEVDFPDEPYNNLIIIEVDCWKGGDSYMRMASIKKSQFDIWLRDKKINTIVDEME